jgi:hypothetical protein
VDNDKKDFGMVYDQPLVVKENGDELTNDENAKRM